MPVPAFVRPAVRPMASGSQDTPESCLR